MKIYDLGNNENCESAEVLDHNNNVAFLENDWRILKSQFPRSMEDTETENSFSFKNAEVFQNHINILGRKKCREIKRELKIRIEELRTEMKSFFRECSRVASKIENRADEHFPDIEIAFAKSQLLEKLFRARLERISVLKEHKKNYYRLLKKVNQWKRFYSFSDLGWKIKRLLNDFDEIGELEDFHICFLPSDDGLGELVLSASARDSTVEARGSVVADLVSTCYVNVRNILGEPARSDFTLDVTLVDGDDNPVYLIIKNLKNSRFEIEFLPVTEGRHILFAKVNGTPVSGSPKLINVREPETILDVVFGENGEGDGQFARPWGVTCDAEGRIIVSDRCNNRIQIFSGDGKFLKKFGKKGSAPGELDRPTGLATDKFQRIIVSDKDNHRIQIFDSDGGYITHFGKFGTVDSNLYYPWDVAVTDHCQIAVTETKRKRIRVFTDTGIELMKFDFTQDKGLDLPRGVTILPEGSFLVSDFNRHRIVLLNSDFTRVSYFGFQGAKPQEFLRPQSVACRDGVFAVSDCKNHRIQLFKNNKVWKIIGVHGSDKEKMNAPQGIAFHPDGRLIVVDYGNSRIQIFKV